MAADLFFPRLNVTILQTYIVPNRWAFFSDSAMIEASIHGRIRTCVVSLYGEHGLVTVKRFVGVDWAQLDHLMVCWFRDRPDYAGWLLELQSMQEVAA